MVYTKRNLMTLWKKSVFDELHDCGIAILAIICYKKQTSE